MIYKYKNIKFFIIGKGEKAIIFFHGFGQTPLFYKNFLEYLSSITLVIAPFLSDLINFDEELIKIKEFLNERKIEKVILIGHSMGASLTIKFFLLNPKIVEKIIIFNGLIIKQNLNLFKSALNLFSDFLFDHNFTFNFSQLVLSGFNMLKNFFCRNKNFLYQINYCFKINLASELKKINKPVIIFWSKNDHIIKLDNLKKVNKLIKNSQLKIVNGNHIWFVDRPKETVDFINKCIYANKNLN